MNNKTPKKTYGRKPERTGNGGAKSRYPKKETGSRSLSRKPRRDDAADAKPRYRKQDDEKRPFRSPRNTAEKPYRSRPRREGDFDNKPRYRKQDDEQRPFRSPRNTAEKPYRSRPRREGDFDNKPRYRKQDDEKRPSRFPRNNAEKPYRSRPRREGDFDNKPRYRTQDDEKRPSRSPRNTAEKPYRSRPRREDDFDRKPRFQRDTDRNFEKPKRAGAAKHIASKSLQPDMENLIDEIRLNKFIANSGICSRREADDYITAGLVSINGKIITELGVKVKPGDDVRFNGERMKGEMKVYVLLNKPKDFVTTTGDPHADRTVMDLIGDKCSQRIFPVGRLDKNTTGVLLLTNDGELCEQLTHPSYNKKKIYHVHLHRKVKVADLRKLIEGVELEDGLAQADEVSYVDGEKSEVGLEIHSGRNRVVRRMFEALDYQVKALDRVYFAGLTKKSLKRGQWRFLTEKEISALRMGAYE